MEGKTKVLLLTSEPKTQEAIASVLQSDEGLHNAGTCRDLPGLVDQLQRTDAAVALVDVGAEPVKMLDELDPIINWYFQTRFVILSTDLNKNLVLRSMQIGARHVQVKKSIESELADVLHRLSPPNSSQAGKQGSVVTVLSASGGCGGTTLAVNLANEFQLANSEPVLLIDLDEHYGAIASYLELKGRYGISDVTAHSGRIDAQLIRSTAVTHSENLRVLLSAASVDFFEPKPLHEEKLEQALAACREAYKFTVIDAPRVSADRAAKLAMASDRTLIVLQLTVKDIRHTRSMMSAMIRREVPADRVFPLVNRYRKGHRMIALKDAEKALGNVSLAFLSNDFASAIRGINYGEPLSKAAPRSALRKELVRLAAEVSEPASSNHNGHQRMLVNHV